MHSGSANPRSPCRGIVRMTLWLFLLLGASFRGAIADTSSMFAQIKLPPATGHPAAPPSQQPPYAVEGITLGMRLGIGNSAFRDFQCVPSIQFAGFTWCTRGRLASESRGSFEAFYSI